MLAAVEGDVRTRPAPGPLWAPLNLPSRPHVRDRQDWARCVCGELWIQAMTCHPCRQPGHPATWCVDGPGEMVDGERVYPGRSAGRWCMCGHKLDPVPAEPVASGARLGPGTLTLTTQAGKSARLEMTGGRLKADTEVDRVTRILADARAGTAGADPLFRAALARQRHLMGLPAIEGLYTLEPPSAMPAGFCGDVPPAAAVVSA